MIWDVHDHIPPKKPQCSWLGLTKGKIEETVPSFFSDTEGFKGVFSTCCISGLAWLGLAATALFKGHGDVAITCYHRQIRSNKWVKHHGNPEMRLLKLPQVRILDIGRKLPHDTKGPSRLPLRHPGEEPCQATFCSWCPWCHIAWPGISVFTEGPGNPDLIIVISGMPPATLFSRFTGDH